MLTIKRLGLADARFLIEGASAKGIETGVPMCVAITDESAPRSQKHRQLRQPSG